MPPNEAPQQVEINGLDDYLDVMSRVVFQSGMSWKVVEAKWPDTRAAFHDFDVDKVAHLSDREVDALCEDKRVIRNRRKLQAVVSNAERMLDLDQEHKGFRNYLRSHGDYWAAAKAIRKDFKFLGDMGIFYFMYVVGEDVPTFEAWKKKLKGT